MKRALITCLVLTIFAGCKQRNQEVAPVLANLIGTWQLVQPDSSYAVTLEFAYDTKNPPIDITPFLASGKSAINDYTARIFATIDGTMQVSELGTTKLGGTPEAIQFEQNYYEKLNSIVRFESPTQTTLNLYHGGTTPGMLVYKKMTQP
ncbi:hypothetical protein WBJ53_31990 [Spirosoma sp. SC4-14]|uniref:hypothetical protein n=1 Tax=Spirosoma sp. SC4-14 TaxID=3128900 RepID=UPI0030D52C19